MLQKKMSPAGMLSLYLLIPSKYVAKIPINKYDGSVLSLLFSGIQYLTFWILNSVAQMFQNTVRPERCLFPVLSIIGEIRPRSFRLHTKMKTTSHQCLGFLFSPITPKSFAAKPSILAFSGLKISLFSGTRSKSLRFLDHVWTSLVFSNIYGCDACRVSRCIDTCGVPKLWSV